MVALMECDARDHLRETLRIATHELRWALDEEFRLVLSGEDPELHYETVVGEGVHHHRAALKAYREHIREHGCARQGADRSMARRPAP